MRILYLLTTGAADPTKASLPVHLAVNGSVAIGDQPEIFMAGDATEYIIGDTIGAAQGVGVPTLKDLFNLVREHRIPVHV